MVRKIGVDAAENELVQLRSKFAEASKITPIQNGLLAGEVLFAEGAPSRRELEERQSAPEPLYRRMFTSKAQSVPA